MKNLKGFDLLGLSARDSRVYMALLKTGLSSIRQVADQTGINRGSVYESIKDLMAAGLVNYQQANVNKKYFAEEPNKILDLITHRQEKLVEFEETTKQIMPTLTKQSAYLPYSNIKFYEDHEGIAVILRDVLTTVEGLDDRRYHAISSKPMRKYLYKKFPNFTKQRIKKNIFVNVIAIGGGKSDTVITANRKIIETPTGAHPSSYNIIYGSKFAMISLNDSFNPYGVVIEDQGVADMQRMMFNQMWEGLN